MKDRRMVADAQLGPDPEEGDVGLCPKQRDARLKGRRGQVGNEGPFDSAGERVLEGEDGLWGPIRAQHDLLARLVDRVERMEELFLGPFLVGDELDVVNQEEIE